MIYIIVLIFLLLFIVRFDINGVKSNRDNYYWLTLVVFILIAGLRYRLGSDTVNYLYNYYHEIPKLDYIFSSRFFLWDEEPLFRLLNSIVLTMGGRFYIVQLIHATFVNILLFKYIKRHSDYIFTCLFFYFIWMYAFYNMEEMKASMSLVVCLYANDYILNKKWVRGVLLYVIAGLFHKTAYVLLITPLFFLFGEMVILEYVFVVAAFITGVIVQENFGNYLNLFAISNSASNEVEQYMKMTGMLNQEGRNMTFFIVHIIPFIVYPILSFVYIRIHNHKSRLLKLQPLLFIGIAFVAVQASMNLAYRFVHFYAIYLIMFMAQMFIDMIKNASSKNKELAYLKSIVIMLPLLMLIGRAQLDYSVRYFPYSSVIEKSTYYDREKDYNYSPYPNEY